MEERREGTGETGKASDEVRFPGSDILRGGSPPEILRRLHDGDPLDILPRALGALAREALLLNPKTFVEHCLARVAFESMFYEGSPSLGEWLDRCIIKSAKDLGISQYQEESRRLPVSESPEVEYYRLFSELSGIELELTRLVCLTVNNLPIDQRRVFYAVAIAGKTLNRYVAEGYGPPDKAREALRLASQAVLLAMEERRNEEGGPDG